MIVLLVTKNFAGSVATTSGFFFRNFFLTGSLRHATVATSFDGS